ncbi:MAG: S41 family peptidase [Bacilli bacterium]|nr:S41 family peptidase [Bacilli bacterium]
MKKIDIKTKDKVDRLAKALGIDAEVKRNISSNNDSPFKTSEVFILVIITCVVSLLMGFLLEYRFNYKQGKNLDPELKDFINNYEYIKENYYDKLDKSKLIDGAVAGMLSVLDKNSSYVGTDDSSFNVFLEGNYKGIGVEVYENEGNIIIYKVMDDSPAKKAGLQADDVILKVGDKEVKGMNTSEVSALIKKYTDQFVITYDRKGEISEAKVKVENISISSVYSNIIAKDGKNIGYIRLSIFAANSYEQFKDHLNKFINRGVTDLIIDLRNNSGGHLSVASDILSLFLNSSHPIYQIKDKGKQKKYYSTGKQDYKGKIVILTNGGSASASEVLSSALKEQLNAVLVGEKTYGKGTVQEIQTLSTGGKYKLTTKIWLTSKGKNIDQKGVEPDVIEKLNENYYEAPKEENDNQLNRAISEILK